MFADLDVGLFSRMVEIVAKEDSDSKRDIRTTKKGILNVAESKLPGIFHDLLHRFPFRRLRPVKIQLLANPGVRKKDWSCHVENFEECEPYNRKKREDGIESEKGGWNKVWGIFVMWMSWTVRSVLMIP